MRRGEVCSAEAIHPNKATKKIEANCILISLVKTEKGKKDPEGCTLGWLFGAHTSSMLEVTTGEGRLRRVMTVMGGGRDASEGEKSRARRWRTRVWR
jgi:hypothetical protein